MRDIAELRKWAALTVFVVQNAGVVLLMRYSRVVPAGSPYSSRVAVLLQEAIKLPICSILFCIESGGVVSGAIALRDDLKSNFVEWLQLALPALLYTLQNNALFVGLSNLEAAVAHVTYQSKIFFTAVFSICILGKRLGKMQWFGLFMLVLGVVCVQGLLDHLLPPKPLSNAGSPTDAHLSETTKSARKLPHSQQGRALAEVVEFALGPAHDPEGQMRMLAEASASNFVIGVSAMLLAAICTSFASVYFEKMLKGSRKPSLWLRNIQLASYSAGIAVISVLVEEDALRAQEGWLHGFSPVTWGVVGMNVCGGLLVAVTIKYADNIMRGFAQAVAIIVGAVGSHFLFDFHFTKFFVIGAFFVISAILLYGEAVNPQAVCTSAYACLCPKAPSDKSEELDAEEPFILQDGKEIRGSETDEDKDVGKPGA